ncbi:SUMF1/EgtB/PvdO family nonheme iron enzyme [Brunnivagina elsteri]|uniref:Peptidase C14 n=1 Tax=Brunnivagina elsteri CCALA 953 TaxID=987040 RepID=A0A2A2TQI6_9CYAN|nr:SUMF1/EgtB/PvdO family nonheme iron enzyme [Calothrix elsteri]PAX60702.1 peptidase C14 [Calothrix elsteri CCALA 953]
MGKNWAIAIGINNYDNLQPLKYAQRDAEVMATWFGEEKHQGVITFYSCNVNQQSFEIDELQHGAFTYSLLEGLRLQGEANCATVERLNQYLNRRVPQVNTNYRKPIQNPYLKAEPPYKVYSILLEQSATLKDVEPLRYQAALAENKGDLQLAKQLWIRVLAISRVDLDAIAAIERIARKPQQFSSNSSSRGANSSTGKRSTFSLEPISNLFRENKEEAERRKQQEAEKKQQQKELEEKRQREQEAQKQRELQKAEIRKQQQEAERKQRQELDRCRKQQEVETRRQQREQQWQNLQQLLVNRRQFLKWTGFGAGGLVTTVIASKFFPASPKITSPIKNAPKILELPVWTVQFEAVTVNNKGEEVKREAKTVKFIKEDLGNGVALDMVYIPAGSFIMGSKPPEGSDSERPQQQVNVSAFCMGKHPITQAQWKAVAAFLPQINRKLEPNPSNFKGDNRPVERVFWYDAAEFCARLSKKTGRQYRLPSEAEWEYACRAGTTTPFHFGETITSKLANYDASYTFAEEAKGVYRQQTTPVGQFPANAFGLHDMHGNVWEWCLDHWHGNYNNAPNNGSAWIDKDNNQHQLLRGGFWFIKPVNCRSAFRSLNARENRNLNIGFRVVVVPA